MGRSGRTRRSGLLLALAAVLAGGWAWAAPTPDPQPAPPPAAPQVRKKHPAHRGRKRSRRESPGTARRPEPGSLWPGEGEPEVERVRRCIVDRETGGDYRAEDPTHTWFGAYQFQQRTADAAARRMHRPDLVGVPANRWLPEEQDAAFYLIYDRGRGRMHWFGGRIPCF